MRKAEKVVINALAYKQSSSGIGVMIRELFEAFARKAELPCQIVVTENAPRLEGFRNEDILKAPCRYEEGLRRIWFQTAVMGRKYGKNSVLLFTDSKIPFFLPRSCIAMPLVTDLAVIRMPKVYRTSRVLLWRLQYRYVTRRADFFLAVSQFTKNEMVELLHIPAERIEVIPCACGANLKREENAAALERVRTKYNLPKRYILFVGNSNPRKNLHRLMGAFARLWEQGYSCELVIAGEQGWKFDSEKEARVFACREQIHFIGFVPDEDMSALYSAASVFAFPTLYEGFGIPVLEAQRCGVPVLTSKVSSLPEVGGEGAIYVDPYSEEDICEGLIRILSDPALTEELVRRGYENEKRYSWEKSAEKLNEIIERNVK